MIATLSIRLKIILLTVFLLVTSGALGVTAIVSIRGINELTVELGNVWLPSVRILGKLASDVNTYRTGIRDHILGETVEQKQLADRKMGKAIASISAARSEYLPLISSPQEKAIFDEWDKAWSVYVGKVAEIIALSRKSTGQPAHEARELLSRISATRIEELLEKDIALNNDGANTAVKGAALTYGRVIQVTTALITAALFGGTIVGFLVIRSVSAGISSIIKPMQALGEGDLTAEVPYRGARTEIGLLADVLQIFKEALIAKKSADEAASRDAQAKIERGRRVDTVTRNFEAAIAEIVETVSSASNELEASAGTLTATAERSQELTAAVATGSEEASANVQAVASATEELSSSISEISRRVQESARFAGDAVEQARKTNDRVSELSRAADHIGDVVELINTIARQTNLLALNATIEAARAGDAGRGFAVVAAEVKALAEQTEKATGEIGRQVSGIQAATQESVGAIRQIGGTIEQLSEIASTIASAVEEQGAATQEISRNVQQAAMGTQRVSSNVTDVQRGTSDTGSASSQVLSAAQSLAGDSARLKVEVYNFLESVRAA